MFISDVTTQSQKDHKLFSTTYILCSKKFCIKKIPIQQLIQMFVLAHDYDCLRLFQSLEALTN